jgi:Ca-activated chloride channel family protein
MKTNLMPSVKTDGYHPQPNPRRGFRELLPVRFPSGHLWRNDWRRIFIVAFAVFVSFAAFAFQTPLPAAADGLVIVQCPPIVIPLGTPEPIRPPIEIQPAIPPITPRPIVPPLPPVRRDCSTYLAVKNHNVNVTIDNQIARTRVDQTFINDSTYALEGTYIFPLPDDAAISEFAMWVDGKKLEGQVLDKNQARRIYEDIVRSQRDPALLEYVGRNAFQARIFPIPPKTEKRVEIEYSQILKTDSSTLQGSAQSGLVRYVYPLNTEKFSPKPLANVSVNVLIKSNAALKAIYSPSHNVGITRSGDYVAKVGYEDKNVRPDRDFVLYYSVTQDEIGLNLVSYKQAGEDGFFVMLVAPQVEIDKSRVIDKDVILVLDVSGSMQGSKIAQAKNALYYVLDRLNPNDRFNIITFSTGTRAYATALRPASMRDDGRNFVSRIVAEGSTDINRALLEAMNSADPSTSLRAGVERPTIVIFLTDGLPTTGETNTQKIIANVTNAAPKNVRLFAFGVGDDVNTILLDTLAEKIRGASGYVRPTEKIDEIVSAFYAKVSTPVLSDISLDWGGIAVNDVYPYPLPDLFAGTQLVVTGRYRTGGAATITLKGTINGVPQTFRYSDVSFRNSGGDDSIPRLWAQRKIGYLMNEIRLRGENREIINEIVALAIRYGIITPYTSFLVDERSDVLTQTGRENAAKQAQATAAPPLPQSGAAAVDRSQFESQMRSSAAAAPAPTKAPAPVAPGQSAPSDAYRDALALQYVGDKTFISRSGVWIDTQFDPAKMKTTQIEFGSDAYFALVANHPLAGKYVALGSRVIFLLNGVAYEITDGGTGATSASIIPTAIPVSPTPEARALPGTTSSSSRANVPGSSSSQSTGGNVALPVCGGSVLSFAMLFGLIGWSMLRQKS